MVASEIAAHRPRHSLPAQRWQGPQNAIEAKPVKNGKSAKGKKAARDVKAEVEDAADEKPELV